MRHKEIGSHHKQTFVIVLMLIQAPRHFYLAKNFIPDFMLEIDKALKMMNLTFIAGKTVNIRVDSQFHKSEINPVTPQQSYIYLNGSFLTYETEYQNEY